ncbi:MAG TPA: hypothetical protein DGG95_06090 [Cytophagales bacterium]|nr:hypothetical protein [Cytophagales bacterium]
MQGFTLLIKSIVEVAPTKLQESIDVLKANLFDVGNAHALELGLKGKLNGEPAEYLAFVKKKAASIEADMCFGAIFGGGTENEIKALSQYGRILGILTTLREEFIDVFEIEELAQKMNIDRLPIPMIFAMQDPKTKKEIEKILLKKRIAKKDLETIIDTVFEAESVKKLKKEMEDFAAQAIYVLRILQGKELCKQLELWVSSMLEDL